MSCNERPSSRIKMVKSREDPGAPTPGHPAGAGEH